MDQESMRALYDGLVLRSLTCKHRGGAKRRGKRCEQRMIVAYDDESLTADLRVDHPRSPYDQHEVRRISTDDLMAEWVVTADGTFSVLLQDRAILRVMAPP